MSQWPLHLPKLIAHRGASAYAPENTLSAMRQAKKLGAQWIETDVTLTADNHAICFHDETLQRTTNGQGNIHHTPYTTLNTLDAGSWFNPQFAREIIPDFTTLLSTVADLDMGINIELKPPPDRIQETVRQVLNITDHYWHKSRSMLLFSSFDYTALLRLRNLRSDLAIGLLLSDWQNNWLTLATEVTACSIHLPLSSITFERVQQIKEKQFYLLVYTVNSKQTAQQLFSWGVDSIFSDYPDLLLLDTHE